MPEKSNRISFVTPATKRKKLDQMADVFGKNLSAVVNEALDRYIDLYDWQLNHIEKGVNAAAKGEFASEREVRNFFKKYGRTE